MRTQRQRTQNCVETGIGKDCDDDDTNVYDGKKKKPTTNVKHETTRDKILDFTNWNIEVDESAHSVMNVCINLFNEKRNKKQIISK